MRAGGLTSGRSTAALVAVVAQLTWAPDASATIPPDPCDPPADSVLLVNNAVAHVYRRAGTPSARTVLCHEASGQTFVLADEYHIGGWLLVFDPPAMTLAGHWLLYGTVGSGKPELSSVTLLDVRPGKPVAFFDAGPSVDDLVLGSAAVSPTGAAAWISCPEGPSQGDQRYCRRPGHLDYVYKVERGSLRPKLLDSGRGIAPRSLRRRGSTITWRRDGEVQRATLR